MTQITGTQSKKITKGSLVSDFAKNASTCLLGPTKKNDPPNYKIGTNVYRIAVKILPPWQPELAKVTPKNQHAKNITPLPHSLKRVPLIGLFSSCSADSTPGIAAVAAFLADSYPASRISFFI